MSRVMIRPVPSGVKFDLKAPNGQTVLTSEVYATEAACRRGIASIRKNAALAQVADLTLGEICPNPRFEVYQDKAGAYRFRLRSRNGRIVGVSEGYQTKVGCRNGIDSVIENAQEE